MLCQSDFSEGALAQETFCMRVKTPEEAKALYDAVIAARESNKRLAAGGAQAAAAPADAPAAAGGFVFTGGESANVLSEADAQARAARVSGVSYKLHLSLTSGGSLVGPSRVIVASQHRCRH